MKQTKNRMGSLGRVAALAVSAALALGPLAACQPSMSAIEESPTSVQTVDVQTGETNGSPDAKETATETYALTDEGFALSPEATGYVDVPYYEPYNTEEYAAIDEGGFIATATRPLSTVSADVDTASYANLRRMIYAGYKMASDERSEEVERIIEDEYWGDEDWYYESEQLIPKGAVRIEEMLNYFDYGYAKPTGSESFAITKSLGPCPWNDKTELLTLGFATPADDSARETGVNLVFLIDVSGSMDDPDKLPLLQDSFVDLLEQLGPDDTVSVVTYASGEELVLDGMKASDEREIMKAIYQLKASGSTNGERGLELAYDIAQKHFVEGGVNRIILASDGDLNVGKTSESDLNDFVAKKRDTGVYLSVLGFGQGNYKDTKMETLADNGNGSYHYIDSEEEAKRVFGEKLCANLVPFADDVKFQVEFNPGQVKAYRLIGYENRTMADEDFRDDTVDAGDVGPEAQFTVAYEIVRADSDFELPETDLKYQQTTVSDSSDWLTCTLRYRAFADGEYHEQAVTVDESAWAQAPGKDWDLQAAIIELGMLLRDSDYKGTSSLDTVDGLLAGVEANEEVKGLKSMVSLLK